MVTTNALAGAVHIGEGDLPGLLYGAVISASVLATASAHSEQYEYVALAAFAVVTVYWLAHVYVGLHGRRGETPTRASGTGSPPAPATRPACSRAGSRPSWSTSSARCSG